MAKKDGQYARRFSMVDHLMTEDKLFRELDDPWCKYVLLYLYLTPNSRDGLVRISMDDISDTLSIKRTDVPGILDDLQVAGRIYRRGRNIVLMDWRDWQGGSKHKDEGSRATVTKRIVNWVLKNIRALEEDVLDKYAESCGCRNQDDFFAILDRPDTRGGDHRSDSFRRKIDGRGSGTKHDQNN